MLEYKRHDRTNNGYARAARIAPRTSAAAMVKRSTNSPAHMLHGLPTARRLRDSAESQALAPDRAVVSHDTDTVSGNTVDSTVPWCNAPYENNAARCWSLVTNGCANNGYLVNVSQDPNASSSTSQNATVNCALCTAGIDDPAR